MVATFWEFVKENRLQTMTPRISLPSPSFFE